MTSICAGLRIGRLTVIGEAGRNRAKQRKLLVRCDCGKEVAMLETNLKRKTKGDKSCGCLKFKHGLWRTRAYETWAGMMRRCYDKKDRNYRNYGARGIIVCERWHDFKNFFEDMGDRPSGLSIDRIDNNEGYFKDNCRWASYVEQGRNRRSNRLVTVNGITRTLTEWADETGISISLASARINRLGWSEEDAVTTKTTRVEYVEKDALIEALKEANGNKVAAARMLGCTRDKLYGAMRNYRLM